MSYKNQVLGRSGKFQDTEVSRITSLYTEATLKMTLLSTMHDSIGSTSKRRKAECIEKRRKTECTDLM